jgi:ribonucleoside-diphosphate reductase alpha chain
MSSPYESSKLDYHSLNALLAIPTDDSKINFEADKEAVRRYFLDHVNQNTVFFHSLEEKIAHLIEKEYYEPDTFDLYDFDFVKSLYKKIYGIKFRFRTFMGAFKFYTQYAMKTFDGSRYIERYEDRVVLTALYLAQGDETLAESIAHAIVRGEYQPATPTFLNAGKAQRGELVSCFLIRVEDNRESISRAWNAALQLSARGGGVAFSLTNLRESGAPIKQIENQASGLIPVMKVLEDIFSYANQLGARDGAGAVYVNAHHPDIMKVLDTKRENADEKIRIKTLSLGIVVPDITFELAKKNETMYLFSPYDVERVYGKPMSDLSITEHYYDMVANPDIRKTEISPRELFSRIAEIQFESGYPYLVFEDNVNAVNPIEGRVSMSNLCSEILQVSTPSTYNEDLTYAEVGNDISCNLGSMNVAKAVDSPSLEALVDTAIRALSAVAVNSSLDCVPSVKKANDEGRAIGLGQMNLHGFFGRELMHYGDDESLDFTNIYFSMIAFYALKASNKIAIETKAPFEGFEKSKYASGEFFDKYINESWKWTPKFDKTVRLLGRHRIPTVADWIELKRSIQTHGLFNSYLQAVPPTGSISYINDATSSIHPIAQRVENRKEGKTGRVFYPAPGMTNDNTEYFKDAFEIGPEKVIDVYAAATQHVDQGLSLTLFYKSTATTRDVNKAQIYAWTKGIKTMYYIRTRQESLDATVDTDINSCTACAL